MATPRPVGVSSRLRRVPGARRPWTSPDGQVVELPLALDVVSMSATGALEWRVDAVVDRVDGAPALTSVTVQSAGGLDARHMQTTFRWATPLDVIGTTVPELLAADRDPFANDYAVQGYPDAAEIRRAPGRRLTDAFLEDVAQRYLAAGRGYAATLAEAYQVSPRTVVSWVEKARARGILTATTPGVAGGTVAPRR